MTKNGINFFVVRRKCLFNCFPHLGAVTFSILYQPTIIFRFGLLSYAYLSCSSAGDKKSAIHLQHAAQMRALLQALDQKGDNILCLADDKGDAI